MTKSGATAGLPTFGKPGTDFPAAREIIIAPAGNNSAAAAAGTYQVINAIVYFEPGVHILDRTLYTGNHAYYVGGYTTKAGKAVIDGRGGNGGFMSKPSSGHIVDNTWEYLTIRNFVSSENDAVLGDINPNYGSGRDDGDTYWRVTIGPNEYGYVGQPKPRYGKSSGGGYGVNVGNYTTITQSCLTQNAQGAFNGNSVIGVNISQNEISWNGLGEYPDTPGSGGSPYSCGCSGGGKLFDTVNATVDYNYVHDNYNAGIWFDYLNTGADISYNYISSNWSYGIEYEASYNADITNNTLVGNGWASDGNWPTGVNGGNCHDVTCTQGGGLIAASYGNPESAIYIPNSGGNANLNKVSVPYSVTVPGCTANCEVSSRYSGQLAVTGNNLLNNFGGVDVYTDTNRYPGDIDHDASCATPLGALQETNSRTYYQQGTILETAKADAKISGRTVTTAGGTQALCNDFGKSPQKGPAYDVYNVTKAPVIGMAVFNMNSGSLLGTVTSVKNAHSFTLSDSPGNVSGASLLLSAYGGCGPADYYRSNIDVASGTPTADYWNNCLLGSENVTVSGNTFSINASAVKGCTAAHFCGYQQLIAFNAGVPRLLQFFDSYSNLIARASGGLGNVWSNNNYVWTGPGGWQFEAGLMTSTVSWKQWQAAPYNQDQGSTFPGS